MVSGRWLQLPLNMKSIGFSVHLVPTIKTQYGYLSIDSALLRACMLFTEMHATGQPVMSLHYWGLVQKLRHTIEAIHVRVK